MTLPSSELVLNPDGSIYHLKLQPEQLADTVIVVGDQGRVETISKHFDVIECRVQNREFVTHTGTYRGKRISAISTGIGTDNLDIVMNELDALVNIDLKNRVIRDTHHSLDIVRIGTSGTLVKDIPVDSVIVSTHGLGFDGLLHFYSFQENEREQAILSAILKQLHLPESLNRPYLVESDPVLFSKLSPGFFTGITATACGFYGPQGRTLRLTPAVPDLNERMMGFKHQDLLITNFEMETSALFGLSRLLGHRSATACAIIANRASLEYSKDYKPVIENLITSVLDRLSA
ncbi:MAG TPA: nucleoside phosphorylase [Flavobacteriales bacterium]|nr:nucleoside phosphorylase [Flavobacteriales bacterium]